MFEPGTSNKEEQLASRLKKCSVHPRMEPYVDDLMTPEDWVFVDAADETGLLPEGRFQIEELERAYRRGILDQKEVEGQRRFCVGTFHKRMECCMRGERSRFEALPAEVRAAMVAYEQDIDLWVLPTRKAGVNQGIITPLPIEAALEKVEESTCRYYVQECDCRVYHHDTVHMRDSCIHFFEGEAPLNSNLHRGYGRELTKEQVKDLLVELDRDGLVHNWEGHGFCNCCACCCWAMRGIKDYQAKGYDLFGEYIQASYVIQTHPGVCIGCGACVSICPTRALHLENSVISVDRNRCLGCGVCRTRCHVQALTIAVREG